jgi:hypothetical protein
MTRVIQKFLRGLLVTYECLNSVFFLLWLYSVFNLLASHEQY